MKKETKKTYWHVIRTKNSVRVAPKNTSDCQAVKGSVASFETRPFAVAQANATPII